MKGFSVTGPGQGSVTDVAIPETEPGQALIKVRYAGICGGDPRLFALNTYGATPEKPIIYGHEFVGRVERIHNPLGLPSRVAVGDRVVGHQDRPCHVCPQCIAGKPVICSAEYGKRERSTGCFAEYLTRDLPYVFKIDDHVSSEVAALSEPLAVAVYDLRQSRLRQDDSVLIIGGGTIGILIGLTARLTGVRNIVFSEISSSRVRFLESLGFRAADPLSDSLAEVLKEQCGQEQADCVFEVSGAQSAYDTAFTLVKDGGKVVLVALPAARKQIDFQAIFAKSLHVISVNSHQLDDFSTAVDIINSGRINETLGRLITSIYPLEQLDKAYAASLDKDGGDIKVLVDCQVSA